MELIPVFGSFLPFDSFATACDFVLVTLCVYHMAERRVEKDHKSPNQHQLSENSYRKAFKIFSDSCGKLSKYSGIPTANDQNISNCLEYSLVFQNIVHFPPYNPSPQ